MARHDHDGRADRCRVAAIALAVAACGAPLPPDFGGEPLWDAIELADAMDMGGLVGEVPVDERQAAGSIRLTDVSDAVGLEGLRSGGNTHGVGVAFVDLDADAWADILVVNGRSNVTGAWVASLHLRNRGDGTFEDVSLASGFAAILDGVDGYSVAAGDLDRDGDVDVYVGAQPFDRLLRNAGDGTFEDATTDAGAGGPMSEGGLVGDGRSKIVSIGDFDDDGWLDLVSASSTLPQPGAYLLRNRGDGTFEDVTAGSGVAIHPNGNPCAVMWSDIDADADRDLWIWNDRGGKVLLRNDSGRFSDITVASEVSAVGITNPMGIEAADLDHDGDLDYYVSNIRNNPLLRNNGDGTFVDVTGLAGTGGEYGWGVALEDLDGDAWADIFVAQEDAMPDLVFHNRREVPLRFARVEVPHPPVLDHSAAHNVAVAVADYDHDGRIDVLTARTDGSRPTLYRNETDLGTHGFVEVAIAEGDLGIGTRIAVSSGELVQFRDVTGGSSRASQNELVVRFGLGHRRGADWVAALWPDGRQSVVKNVATGTRVTLP